jgi:hypothetical protein
LAAALGLFLALLLLAAQAPLHYTIEIGKDEGYGSDRPIVADFHDPEISPSTGSNFRWTTQHSLIRLPGVGQRPLQLRLRLLPVSQVVAERGPKEIEVWAGDALVGSLPIRPTSGGIYYLVAPAPPDGSGNQEIELRGTTITPTGDSRAIGTPVDAALVESAGGPVWPAWGSTLLWLIAALLFWLGLRRAGLAPNAALIGLVVGILSAGLAAWVDPPRFAFGATPAATALALGWLLMLLLNAAPEGLLLAGVALVLPAAALLAALGSSEYENWGGPGAAALGVAAALLLAGWLRPALGALYRRAAPPIPPAARAWLMLMALLVLATRYGGKIYPDAMWGDIGFHINRYTEVLQGLVLLLSRNRGVDFPYPPVFYLLLMPFSLLGLDRRVLLQLGGALLDAASPFLVYTLAICGLACASGDRTSARLQRIGLLAAGIYSLSASGFMITWWNFSTHTFSQFAHLLLITALVLILDFGFAIYHYPQDTSNPKSKIQNPKWVIALFFLQSLVYLGHFGFWMNTTLLGGMGLAALLVACLRARRSEATEVAPEEPAAGRPPAWTEASISSTQVGDRRNAPSARFQSPAQPRSIWRSFWNLLAAFVAAELFAALIYYSAYTGLFIAQAQATASGGLTGLANRGPTDRALLWQNLWDAGFRIHFGFFAVPLGLCGVLLLWQRTNDERRTMKEVKFGSFVFRHSSLVVLMLGTLIIALLFGSLPFITGSTLSTRWLMFSAWVIAVGAAVTAQLLWRAGRAGRWLLFAMGGYMLWITASQWIGALAWRIRPPEPF